MEQLAIIYDTGWVSLGYKYNRQISSIHQCK